MRGIPGNFKEKEFRKLINRYVSGKATKKEIHFLELYYKEYEKESDLLDGLSAEEVNNIGERIKKNISEGVFYAERNRGKVVVLNRSWMKAAVIVGALLLGSLSYFLIHRPNVLQPISKIQPQHDVMPGGNKAILTLGDGTKIVLDSANNGAITKEGNVTVIKLDDGQLAYKPSTLNPLKSSLSYNTITTPKGGQYQLVLSDGTKVWLNAESSLIFPAEFVKSERKVELTGEGYFEVANDKTRPFLVTVNDMSVKVLGTHFNVSAYTDEKSIKTTLLEGSVEMMNNGKFVMLKPGEQGRFQVESKALQITRNVDLDETMAWKNNEFVFNETELKEAMRQLSRWYDIKIQYDEELAPVYLYGSISRNKGLAEVLKIMETSGLKFKIERVGSENKLTIMKQIN